MKKYSEKDIRSVCKIIENRLRALGPDCQIQLLSDTVTVAPPRWSGEASGDSLYEALLDAETNE